MLPFFTVADDTHHIIFSCFGIGPLVPKRERFVAKVWGRHFNVSTSQVHKKGCLGLEGKNPT